MAGIKWVLASDIDGTLVGHGGERELVAFLSQHREVGVVYLTGRTRANAQALLKRHDFPAPLALATNVGADIYWGASLTADEGWAFQQRRDWSPRRVIQALEGVEGVCYQARSSYWRIAFSAGDAQAVARARAELVHAGIACRSLWDDHQGRLDVIPRGALKGRALKHILNRLNIRPQQCFVAGDAENDGDLLGGRYRGVVVANGTLAQQDRLPPEIVRSPFEGAYGVLDGLKQFLSQSTLMAREYVG